MRLLERSRAALADMLEVYEHIGRESPAAAERFLDECERVFGLLARRPRVGRERPELGRGRLVVRSALLASFPSYVVFYRVSRRSVVILRVLHGARDVRDDLLRE